MSSYQSKEDYELTITGKATLTYMPDTTIITVTMGATGKTYAKAYEQGIANNKTLLDILQELQIDTSKCTTGKFDTEKKTKKSFTGNEVADGFRLTQKATIEIGLDGDLLYQLLQRIGTRIEDSEIEIQHTTKDTRALQLKALRIATEDARERAEIMTLAAGCRLGSVKKINIAGENNYTWERTRVPMYNSPRIVGKVDFGAMDDMEAMDDDFEPETLDLTPKQATLTMKVHVEWELKDLDSPDSATE